jgi:cytochrome c biogenesis factor
MNIWLAGSAAILIALLITPYLWAYDQILLILPILSISNTLARIKTPYFIVSLLPIMFTILSLVLLYLASIKGHDVSSILLTIITGGLLIWAEIRMRKYENGSIVN